MRVLKLLALAAALLPGTLLAANTKQTVEQVTETVTLADDVDYIVTSSTPFATDGVVNITNTDHAVLILADVKPGKLTAAVLGAHVQVNGQKAVNNSNCQVKMYNRGCIILPYSKNLKPLTVYSEPDFGGEACSDFGLESSGGFMNTLSDAKLNNRIRSFRLKRGYMVTFSLLPEGRGYSRCFIADDEDLEVAAMPTIMDRSISSYRVFTWYDAGKPQLAAAGGDANACSALNVTSTYSWNAGTSMLPGVECVSHQIYSYYPSAAACGGVNYTCHMKTSNEPRNSSDDHPEDLNAILGNWENLMRTGMRLCSPSSWDGSDYWNGTGFLKTFFDSIDARGWRCDILDMHCYWPEGNFGNLKNWVNAVHRPIWISEWCWGASWNSNGAFASGVTETQVRDALQRICNNLNGMDYVERYFYWNGERDPSRIYKSGSLTQAGKMYAELDGGLAYNGKYDYVPKAPKQLDPADFAIVFDRAKQQATLSWYEYNGEQNEYIRVECRHSSADSWQTIMELTGGETPERITVSDLEAHQGWEFRVTERDANGRTRTTRALMAASNELRGGDAVDIDGETYYLGGNVLTNGDFELGLQGWTNGTGEALGKPWFQAVPAGGPDGSAYLQAYGNGSLNAETSVKTSISLQPNTRYYFSADACYLTGTTSQLVLSVDGVKSSQIVAMLDNTTPNWLTKFVVFDSGDYEHAILTFRSLGSKAQFDNVMVCQLFKNEADALADALTAEKQRAQAAISYCGNRYAEAVNRAIEQAGEPSSETIDYIHQKTDEVIASYRLFNELERLLTDGRELLANYHFAAYDELSEAVDQTANLLASSLPAAATDTDLLAYNRLNDAIHTFMPMTTVTDKVQQPSFASTTGWKTKVGTYKDGTQSATTLDGVKYWRAFWSLEKEGNEAETMAIAQDVSGLAHGLYAVECQAGTDHFCLSDQHAYITDGTVTYTTPTLTADYLDLPTVADSVRWQTLTSLPLYVDEGGTVTIGFEGSKALADDLAWRERAATNSKGDHREGWWGATAFRLRFHPLYRKQVTPQTWGVSCLPYAVAPSPGITFYELAGVNADYTQLCLREIAEVEAGVPFIFSAQQEMAEFLEQGEAVATATSGPCNLRGFLWSASSVPVGAYALQEGSWQKVVQGSRPRIGTFNAYIRAFTDNASQAVPVIDGWSGPTIPIQGVTAEEIEANNARSGIATVAGGSTPATTYGLNGQPANATRPGVYIQRSAGKTQKVIIR